MAILFLRAQQAARQMQDMLWALPGLRVQRAQQDHRVLKVTQAHRGQMVQQQRLALVLQIQAHQAAMQQLVILVTVKMLYLISLYHQA